MPQLVSLKFWRHCWHVLCLVIQRVFLWLIITVPQSNKAFLDREWKDCNQQWHVGDSIDSYSRICQRFQFQQWLVMRTLYLLLKNQRCHSDISVKCLTQYEWRLLDQNMCGEGGWDLQKCSSLLMQRKANVLENHIYINQHCHFCCKNS